MGESNRQIAIVFCCMSLLIKPAHAFWPVLDFGEIIPIVSNVTTSLDSLSQTKEQLKQLSDGLKAIGDAVDNVAQFSQDLRNNLNDIKDIVDESAGIVNDTFGTNINIQESLTGAIDAVNGAQSGLVGDFVDQTQGALDKGTNIGNQAASGINAVQKTGNDAEKLLNKAKDKGAAEEEPVVVEEEEEEEEVAEVAKTESVREEIKAGFEAVKDENQKLAEQLNDVLDTSLNTLHKAAARSRLALDAIGDAVNRAENIKAVDKGVLQKKLSALQDKQQKLADRISAVIESVKDEYNAQYKAQIADGINNYEKAVEQYLRGDADIATVKAAGDRLKEDAAAINPMPDLGTLNSLRAETESLKKEVEMLRQEIQQAGQKKENNS